MHSRRDIIKNGAGAILGMVLVSLGIGQGHAKPEDEPFVVTGEIGPEKIRVIDDAKLDHISFGELPMVESKWYGPDGTLFKIEPLAQTRASWDYLLAAYPRWLSHQSRLTDVQEWMNEYEYVPYYQKIEFSDQLVTSVGTENIYDMIHQYIHDFEFDFYANVKDHGYLTSPESFGKVYASPEEVAGWGKSTEAPHVMWGSEFGGMQRR